MNKNWIFLGMRPKTLVAGIVPPIVAYSVYYSKASFQNFDILIFCMLLAIFIQIATNFYNDAIDFKKGADKDRVGPKRVTENYSIPYKKVMMMGHLFLTFAFVVGIPLVIQGGPLFLFFGLLSLFLAYGYTGGPLPLAYFGLGELFVFLFFGLVATIGSFYLYAKTITIEITLISMQLGLLSCVLIAINNFRDRISDAKVNKKTLATRMGKKNYLILINLFLFIPYVIQGILIVLNPRCFLPLLAISMAYRIKNGLEKNEDLIDCNALLALSAKHLLLFSLFQVIVNLWI